VADRRELAAQLATVRSLAGLSQRGMARELGVNQMRVSRIESGETLPSQGLTQRWLQIANVDPTTRGAVMALLYQVHAASPTWSKRIATRGHLQYNVAEQERQAARMYTLETTIIPGLLQTADYARAIIDIADVTGEVNQSEAWAARLERQAILHTPGREFHFLIAEPVLGWEPAPGVMAAQLDRLAQLSQLETVELGIVPSSVPLRSWSPFIIYEPENGEPYVSLELNHGPLDVRGSADVAVYRRLWDRFHAAAWTGDGAREVIRAAAS
jgi:transcriptional regulator with XRE-family HTH domain